MAKHLDDGRVAEQLARRFLVNRGLTTITTNYRCRFGELDLIMQDAQLLVVVEIRYRRDANFGGPIESISAAKRRKIAITTQQFIRKYPAYRNAPVRFDVIGIIGPLSAPDIRWLAAAFTMDDL